MAHDPQVHNKYYEAIRGVKWHMTPCMQMVVEGETGKSAKVILSLSFVHNYRSWKWTDEESDFVETIVERSLHH